MKALLMATTLLLSLNSFAAQEVSTQGEELHLTCVMNFTPYFIKIDKTHTKAYFYLNNRRDNQNRGLPREFISQLKLSESFEKADAHELVFSPASRVVNLKAVNVTIPKKMSYYLGKGNQPAFIELEDEALLFGQCYVQFPPMAPQW